MEKFCQDLLLIKNSLDYLELIKDENEDLYYLFGSLELLNKKLNFLIILSDEFIHNNLGAPEFFILNDFEPFDKLPLATKTEIGIKIELTNEKDRNFLFYFVNFLCWLLLAVFTINQGGN